MSEKAAKIVVRGMVQGVGFRVFVMREATNLGLTGWTRNRADGSVEILAEGDSSLLEQLVAQVKIGPRVAQVSGVEVEPIKPTGQFRTFEIKGWAV